MKPILIITIAMLTACTSITTRSASGCESSYRSFGGDSKMVSIKPSGVTIGENKNSPAFRAIGALPLP